MSHAPIVSKREADALEWALHLENVLHGAACSTGKELRLSTMRRLEARGLVVEKWAIMVVGDGFTVEPERHRRCFALTDAGRALAKALDEAARAWSHKRFAAHAAETSTQRETH